MQPLLAHTVTLHRIVPRHGEYSRVTLQPLVAFTEHQNSADSVDSTANMLGNTIVEHHAPLRALLESFAAPLLATQREAALDTTSRSSKGTASSVYEQSPSRRSNDAYETHARLADPSLVAAEGLYIQVPSRGFISACVRSAAATATSAITTTGGNINDSGSIYNTSCAMDVVRYNSLTTTGEEGAQHDDGYVYGFAQYIALGYAGDTMEGMLLTIFSASPQFNVMRAVVLEAVPHAARAAAEMHVNRTHSRGNSGSRMSSNSGSSERNAHDNAANTNTTFRLTEAEHSVASAVLTESLAPLADLVNPSSPVNGVTANHPFYLRFPRNRSSFLRADLSRCPLAGVPFSTLLLSFSYDALRVVQSLLLQERRVVFVGATPQHAAACVISTPTLLLPFVWSLPLVPFIPTEMCDVLDALAFGSGFVLGVTPEMIPPLMLHVDLCSGPDDRSRVWFADARTGVVGVGPREFERAAFAMLDVVPPSDKLKEAMKRVVSKEQRQMFHVAMAGCRSPPPIQLPSSSFVEEAHGAMLEYNTHRLVGNYRKGLVPMQGGKSAQNGVTTTYSTVSGGNCGRIYNTMQNKSPPGAAYAIDYTRFLPANLDNNTLLAQIIAETNMYRHWKDAVVSLETLGILRSLNGEFVRSRMRSQQRDDYNAHRECLATHFYLSHSRMVTILILFYTRAVRRYPELYSELQNINLQGSGAGAAQTYDGSGEYGGKTAFYPGNNNNIGSGSFSSEQSGVSFSGTSGGGRKGMMMTLFNKATKAVKNSLTTHYQRVPLQAFVQAYGSFADRTKYAKDPSKPSALSKEFKDNTAIAAAFTNPSHDYMSGCAVDGSGISLATAPTYVFDEDSLYGICSPTSLFSEEYAGTMRQDTSMGRMDENSASSMVSRRLPLDLIHQFRHYHTLLDPTKSTSFTAGKQRDSTITLSRGQLELLVDIGQLLAAEPSVWPLIERNRHALLCLPTARQQQQQQQQQQHSEKEVQERQPYYGQPSVQQESGLLTQVDNASDTSKCIPFEAQPLPFSLDLVNSTIELPPTTMTPHRYTSDTVTNCNAPSTTTVFNTLVPAQVPQSAPVIASSRAAHYPAAAPPIKESNMMDELFAFATQQEPSTISTSPAATEAKPKQLEDFF